MFLPVWNSVFLPVWNSVPILIEPAQMGRYEAVLGARSGEHVRLDFSGVPVDTAREICRLLREMGSLYPEPSVAVKDPWDEEAVAAVQEKVQKE